MCPWLMQPVAVFMTWLLWQHCLIIEEYGEPCTSYLCTVTLAWGLGSTLGPNYLILHSACGLAISRNYKASEPSGERAPAHCHNAGEVADVTIVCTIWGIAPACGSHSPWTTMDEVPLIATCCINTSKILAYLKKWSSTFILLYGCFNWKCLQNQLKPPYEELYFKKQLTVDEAMVQPLSGLFISFRITSFCISFTEIMSLLHWCSNYVLCDLGMLYLLTFLVPPKQKSLMHPKKNSLS